MFFKLNKNKPLLRRKGEISLQTDDPAFLSRSNIIVQDTVRNSPALGILPLYQGSAKTSHSLKKESKKSIPGILSKQRTENRAQALAKTDSFIHHSETYRTAMTKSTNSAWNRITAQAEPALQETIVLQRLAAASSTPLAFQLKKEAGNALQNPSTAIVEEQHDDDSGKKMPEKRRKHSTLHCRRPTTPPPARTHATTPSVS